MLILCSCGEIWVCQFLVISWSFIVKSRWFFVIIEFLLVGKGWGWADIWEFLTISGDFWGGFDGFWRFIFSVIRSYDDWRGANFPAILAGQRPAAFAALTSGRAEWEDFWVISNVHMKKFWRDWRGVMVIDWAGLFGYDGEVMQRDRSFYMEMRRRKE